MSRMTLAEKIGQLNQISPWDYNDLAGRVAAGQIGFILNVTDPVQVDKIQKVAVEESADGIRWTFAPMIDISRDPRWGRIAESCGEDPYLTSVMGVAMINGFQGESLSDPSSMAACAKHFVGYKI